MRASRMIERFANLQQAEPAGERRRLGRISLLDRVARIDAIGDSGLCQIRNVSDGGTMIFTRIGLSTGGPVRISFDCSNQIQGRVAWQAGTLAGVRFLQQIESAALIGKIAGDRLEGTTRSPRLPVNCKAQAASASFSFPTVIGNISQRGMKICHRGNLEVGTILRISLDNGVTVRGIVRWSVGFFAGIELDSAILVEHLASARNF